MGQQHAARQPARRDRGVPHRGDQCLSKIDAFARRVGRNTSAVLHDESSLARVVDAAGGSWFVESLTDRLAALPGGLAAWFWPSLLIASLAVGVIGASIDYSAGRTTLTVRG